MSCIAACNSKLWKYLNIIMVGNLQELLDSNDVRSLLLMSNLKIREVLEKHFKIEIGEISSKQCFAVLVAALSSPKCQCKIC